MKIVIDANVLVSGLFWRGTPYTLVRRTLFNATDTLLVSDKIIDEFELVFNKQKFADKKAIAEYAIEQIKKIGVMTAIPPDLSVADSLCRDPKDIMYLECAAAGNADYLISGDADLRILQKYRGTSIVNPREYLNIT